MKRLDLLKKIMGEELLESLNKALVKLNTKSVVDLEELHSAIKTAPKAIIAFLLRELKDMNNAETREVTLPWADNSMMTISKMDNDVYRGDIIRDSKIIHKFDLTAIPQLAAHLMSVFELYDEAAEESSSKSDQQPEQKEESSDSDLWEHLRMLDGKVNALMMMVASQSAMSKSEPKESKKFEKFCKSLANLKKAGLMPKMPSPPSPGAKVGGSQGITKEGMHGVKTSATDSHVQQYTQLKNPDLKVPKHNADKASQPKQPKVFSNTNSAQKSEKEIIFKKSELEGNCVDCGQKVSHCACFRALSKPEVKKSENGLVTLKFKGDWDSEAISALWQSLKKSRCE